MSLGLMFSISHISSNVFLCILNVSKFKGYLVLKFPFPFICPRLI